MAVDRTKILAAAQKHLSKGQYDRAIAEYQKLVKADPRDVRTLLKIGDLYTRKGAHHEATATYHRVAEHYAKQGFFLKAVAVYKQILKLQPSRNDVSLRLAEMYENLQLVSDALSTYEQAASAFAREGDIDRALETLGKMAALDPENIPVRIKYAEALSKAGRREEAGNEFEAGAELLREQGRMDDYVKVAERLLYHRADDADLARTLAELYLQRSDAKRALAKLQLCFKQDPKNVETLELLARAFHVLGQTPKTVSVYREMARIHQEAARPEERARILKKILELDPNDAEARQALAGFAPSAKKPSRPVPRVESMPPGAVVDSGSGMILAADDPELEILDDDDDDDDEPVLETMSADESDDIMIVEEDVDIDMMEMEDVEEARPSPASIPPDVAREAQIARLLTECDVFARYGLKSKVIAQLEQVIQLAPHHVEARERLKDAYLDAGRAADAAAQLRALAELFSDKPQVAQMYERRAEELLQTPSMAPPAAEDVLIVEEDLAVQSSGYDAVDEDESDVTLFVDDPLGDLEDLEAEVADLPTGTLHTPPPDDEDDLIFVDDAIEVNASAPGVEEDTLMMEGEDDDILFLDDEPEETAKAPQPAAVKDLRIDDRPSAQSVEIPPSDPMGVILTEEMGLPEPVAPTIDDDDVPEHTVIDTALRIPMGTQPGHVPDLDVPVPDLDVPDLTASLEAPISPLEFEAAPVSAPGGHVQEARERLSVPPGEIEETLDEADFFLAQGLFDAAHATVDDALSSNPGHPLLRDKLQEIAEMRSAAASSQLPPAPSEPQDEAFALAEKLAEELGEDDVDDLSGSDVLDVDSVFEQFKKGVEEQIGLEDTDTHFDLGIAYKEMGLLDDAIHEFELAMANPQRECICQTMIGLCRAEQGRMTDAIGHYKKGLYAETKTEREELGLYYELGHAYEQLDDAKEALYYFQKVAKRAPGFREVEARIKALSEPKPAVAAPEPLVLDDVDSAFDDLLSED